MRDSVGHPSIDEDQPLLLKVISDLAIFGSAADDKRQTETIRSIKTLDQLHDEVQKHGFSLSRSATYLRLLPKSSRTIEGKRHVKTVPVRLVRAQADLHRYHIDGPFATATIRYLESLASFLDPNQVLFISQDDKARVPLGVTAANKQAPLVMHTEYRISLPDHDWVVADRHKLIPSVYVGIVIESGGQGNPSAVSYSGPTFITIRSGKHSSSTANTHAQDLETLLELESFRSISRTNLGTVKPVLILTVDGGPDENPRYLKVIRFAVKHFNDYNLDAVFIATNAPGRSAYNRVERRMAPLSRQLTGLILPHEHFGTHLDSSAKTIDENLERQNFKYAGELLAEVWSEVEIDKYPVNAIYVSSEQPDLPSEPDPIWYSRHVRESQYLLQIVKCDSNECCSPPRSALRRILPNGFLPPPIKVKETPNDLTVDEDGSFLSLQGRRTVEIEPDLKNFLQIPYDYSCPSVQSQLQSRVCKQCGLYYASKKAAIMHCKKVHKLQKDSVEVETYVPHSIRPQRIAAKRANELLCIIKNAETGDEDVDWLLEEDVSSDVDFPVEKVDDSDVYPIIKNMDTWIKGPWVVEDA